MKNAARWGLITLAFAVVAGILARSVLGETSQGTPATEVAASSRADDWMQEIRKSANGRPCPVRGEAKRRAFVQSVYERLGVWRERAGVESPQVLRSYRNIERARRCMGGEVSDVSSKLRAESEILQTELVGRIRTAYALYRRAKARERKEESRRHLLGLLELLEAHDGPLIDKLKNAERSLARGLPLK